ncbi:MAG: hypothetical protein MJ014_08240, partial [Methanocorpusculum sp.]|nr:hypothetical protein [Methanocorpusculum sp.]
MGKMENKVVLITGGGKGIGFGIATAFAKEGANSSPAEPCRGWRTHKRHLRPAAYRSCRSPPTADMK